MQKLIFHFDTNHGWLTVKRDIIKALGLANEISSSSYQKGETVYLEEDRDAPMVLDALDSQGISYTTSFRGVNCDSRIRGYESYSPTVDDDPTVEGYLRRKHNDKA